MYVGRYIHDLKKFEKMDKNERNQIVGRDYDKVQEHKGYDRRPENPKLEKSDDEAHINRGYAAMCKIKKLIFYR
jgi:hypothetical protein